MHTTTTTERRSIHENGYFITLVVIVILFLRVLPHGLYDVLFRIRKDVTVQRKNFSQPNNANRCDYVILCHETHFELPRDLNNLPIVKSFTTKTPICVQFQYDCSDTETGTTFVLLYIFFIHFLKYKCKCKCNFHVI